jgi:hypothetical protein
MGSLLVIEDPSASAAAQHGCPTLAALRERRAKHLTPLGYDPHLPIGWEPPLPPPPPAPPVLVATVDETGITTAAQERIDRKDALLCRALLAAGIRWHQLLPLPEDAFRKQEVPGQPVTKEVVERRKRAYEELRAEALNRVLDKLDELREQQARREARAARAADGEAMSADELAELQRAGLVDPIAKAKAEAKAMMAIEVERQRKLMESKEAKAARELAKVQAAERLAQEKYEESVRVTKMQQEKKEAQAAEVNRRRQEAAQWRFARQLQLKQEEEIAADEAHHSSLLREERDRKIKQREAERREAMQMQRLAFAHKHKQKLARIARERREKEEHLVEIAIETEKKMRAADKVREENRERERQAVAEENAARFAEQVGSNAGFVFQYQAVIHSCEQKQEKHYWYKLRIQQLSGMLISRRCNLGSRSAAVLPKKPRMLHCFAKKQRRSNKKSQMAVRDLRSGNCAR